MKRLLPILFFISFLPKLHAQYLDTAGIWTVIDFESPSNYIKIDTSSQNIWQIGHAQKTHFASSYSGQKAIVTDTINTYPTKNHSFFDLFIGNFNMSGWYPYDIFIDFKYKIDSDTLHDGGYITVSWDNGLTWTNIIDDTIAQQRGFGAYPGVENENLYSHADTLYNGEFGFSGFTAEWKRTFFTWYGIIIKGPKTFPPDTMILRFNFISDSIDNNRDGWLIDHIRLFSIDFPGNINEFFNSDNLVRISPNPASSFATITFLKEYIKAEITVINMQGNQISKVETGPCKNLRFMRDNLPPGLYLFRIKLDNGSEQTLKVIFN
ncbi:MAG: T9SS type A sorting domain-containing protein [Bacteroidota bacterium]